MMAVWLLFTADPLSFWEILFWLFFGVVLILGLPYILAICIGAPALVLLALLEVLTNVLWLLLEFVEFLLRLGWYGNDNGRQTAQRQPPAPSPSQELDEEDFLRQWMDEINQASEDHLHRVRREYE